MPVSDSIMLLMPSDSAVRFILMAARPALKIARLRFTNGVSSKSGRNFFKRKISAQMVIAKAPLKGIGRLKVSCHCSLEKVINDHVWRLTVLGANRPASSMDCISSSLRGSALKDRQLGRLHKSFIAWCASAESTVAGLPVKSAAKFQIQLTICAWSSWRSHCIYFRKASELFIKVKTIPNYKALLYSKGWIIYNGITGAGYLFVDQTAYFYWFRVMLK